MSNQRCPSCSMPIENGTYCSYCVDDEGNLQPFEERFARMVQWMSREDPGLPAEEAKRRTLAFMSSMPAWRDNPKLKAALGG